ncbi:uncharacterized protein LOC110095555 [Dendrobium catenatum]|uniref:Uncharacterized protein n=1 Tax=Dendrobium catenatum TaxID=906689 RepID=A0A2I0W3D9_9ASPA|nr:uncharacterized protein LOC110095555 [Dendrobium catenatum]PKU70164.1 hypothetical protein MA16_Dca010285 [Dendrobium catenatum]
MSCTHSNVFNTTLKLSIPATRLSRTCSVSRVSFLHVATSCISPTQTFKHHKMPSIVHSFPKRKACAPICLFGGQGNSRGENKSFSWDSLKDALKGLRKEKTIQEMLRDQMRKGEFGGDSGDGNPPGRGGGGGSDGTEDEGFAGVLDETLQVVLATIAFLFVYMNIIKGAELTKLARDYIKYLLGGVPTMRLKRVMDKWKRAFEKLSWTEEESEDWLVRKIVMTPTWWHRPEEIVRVMKRKMIESRSGGA